jgi:hypothetical protein
MATKHDTKRSAAAWQHGITLLELCVVVAWCSSSTT